LKYIPDRFNPESPYFLTPDKKKRHPMSFGPFLGGKRICLGKTFVETISKIVGPTILANFEFEFLDKAHYEKKPSNNMMN
jgi:cytochrome P450